MKKKFKFSLIVLILLLITTLVFFSLEDIFSLNINSLVNLINSFGIFSALFYILLMALAVVISPIPSLPLAVASGLVFGTFLGFIYSIIGATIGSIIAFLITRKLGREYFIRKFSKKASYIENIPENKLMLYIFMFRLFPIFHFDVVSYGAGITKISLLRFTIATFFGMMPVTFLLVYTGSMLNLNIAQGLVLITILILVMYFIPKYFIKDNN